MVKRALGGLVSVVALVTVVTALRKVLKPSTPSSSPPLGSPTIGGDTWPPVPTKPDREG